MATACIEGHSSVQADRLDLVPQSREGARNLSHHNLQCLPATAHRSSVSRASAAKDTLRNIEQTGEFVWNLATCRNMGRESELRKR